MRGNFRITDKVPKAQTARKFDDRTETGIFVFPMPTRLYEYRSGRLILGTMMTDGEFVPEAGAKVIKFEDYKCGDDPWIWNLPGYFMRRRLVR